MGRDGWKDGSMSITDELRAVAAKTECANGRCEKLYRGDLDHIADRIDAEHEAKVSYWQGASHKDCYDEGFKDGYDEGFASADDWLGQHEDAMAEHGWVRKNKEHVVSNATVEITLHIDWSRMADELDVFTQLVRGFAEQVEEDE